MALRLTRLQKEISDKNEEIRRLQSELLTESDESSALSGRMDDLKRKVKELEKKNAELEQRLRDCQLPEASGPDSDVEIIHLKKQLKKMQNEYEASCQKYCDLNIEYEALKTRQEKDRKQVKSENFKNVLRVFINILWCHCRLDNYSLISTKLLLGLSANQLNTNFFLTRFELRTSN